MEKPKKPKQLLIDLRSFGAIGFQDATNGLWLGKQGYRPQNGLLKLLADNCINRGIDITAITSEDDKIIPGYPEDRFDFLSNQYLPKGYTSKRIDDTLLRVQNGKGEVYFVNSETLHARQESSWGGLKLHVVGRNKLPKEIPLFDSLKYAQKEGLLTFFSGVTSSQRAEELTKLHKRDYTGIIEHDANNTFPWWVKFIPKVGKKLENHTRLKNREAHFEVCHLNKPGIAVSSSHYIHQMGRAGIYCNAEEIDLTSGPKFLRSLRIALEMPGISFDREFQKREYHPAQEILKFMRLLQKYGQDAQRFKGTLSSYNYH